MSLSANRMRRPNAGSKMSQLLDTEEVVDHFYDSIYGGFQEDDNDIDYTSDESSDSEDMIDSDFSIDENDDPISDDPNEEQMKPKTKQKFGDNRRKPMKAKTKSESIAKEVKVPLVVDIPVIGTIFSSKRLRSTKSDDLVEKIFESRLNGSQKKPSKEMKRKTNGKSCGKEWTQSELLKEAKITEKLNLQSLKEYERLESQKNKTKRVKHSIDGPFIRFNSVSMPLIEELDEQSGEGNGAEVESHKSGAKSYSRTFITFSDEQTFDSWLNSLSNNSSMKSISGMVCPVTQLPARYFDPISELPFANSEAFQAIRTQYYKQLEIYGNVNQSDVKQWIDWKQENGDKWMQWQQQYNTYDTVPQTAQECESHCNQSEAPVPKVGLIPKASHSRRKRKK
ncbi:unnamed protein product [Oppiella nova]|uniref:Vacuolar protein sorting-associated protein 72 homolog n=1 Tax=Oppiella nova TaxID=334625 RepID=A0A7R9QFN7_9ACAR|nr:unnamed protein product [Oppiella nova]CAG2164972.1 unnamed protein product [Oppiella nova]